MIGLLCGAQVLVVGVEPLPFGLVKVYVNARWKGLYVIVGGEAAKQVLRAWADPTVRRLAPAPAPEQVFRDSDGEPDLFV